MPIEDKWFFAKKVWNSELIFYIIVWKTPRHSYRGQMIFCQKSVELRTHLYKIVYKSEQERVLVIFSQTKLNTFSPPGAHLCFLSFPWYRDFEWKSNQSPLSHWINTRGGGALNFFFFSGRGVLPGFPKCGACELTFASEKGGLWAENFHIWGLWAENFQIWGLVSWKFPNLGDCELKFGWKLRLFRLKFPNFLKRGSCEPTLLLEMGPLRAAGEAWKGGLQGRTSPYPLSRSVPPR